MNIAPGRIESDTAERSAFERSNALRPVAHRLIPGGAHTYAKGDDQYPVLAPGFISHGRGCRVWDIDGNEFIEFGMGNRAVGLGHAFVPVVEAATRALGTGCNFTRPSPLEVECAETFLDLVPGADMVKFCKDGSDATSGAVRLARAYTGRDFVAICADHPFFSTDDWFIGTTPVNAGVPQVVRELTLTFRYNDLDGARALFAEYPDRIAAVILEPARAEEPLPGFLHGLRKLAHDNDALFVLDEMITGFRWSTGGGQQAYDIEPDLSCFGKAMGNGFSVSALAGKREFMHLGGLGHTDRPRVFLLSTTHGAESHALAAATTTMRLYRDEPVIDHIYAMGELLRDGVRQVVARHDLQRHIQVIGRPCCLAFTTLDQHGLPSQGFRSLFLQETIRRGILAPSLVVSYSHQPDDIAAAIDAIDGALGLYRRALSDGAEAHLVGRPSQLVYSSHNGPGYP